MHRCLHFAFLLMLTAAAQAETLNNYNWSDYLPEMAITQFTYETGIKVNYITYESNEEIGSVVAEWGDYIEAETLSVALVAGTVPGDADRQESFNLAGNPVTLAVKRA